MAIIATRKWASCPGLLTGALKSWPPFFLYILPILRSNCGVCANDFSLSKSLARKHREAQQLLSSNARISIWLWIFAIIQIIYLLFFFVILVYWLNFAWSNTDSDAHQSPITHHPFSPTNDVRIGATIFLVLGFCYWFHQPFVLRPMRLPGGPPLLIRELTTILRFRSPTSAFLQPASLVVAFATWDLPRFIAD